MKQVKKLALNGVQPIHDAQITYTDPVTGEYYTIRPLAPMLQEFLLKPEVTAVIDDAMIVKFLPDSVTLPYASGRWRIDTYRCIYFNDEILANVYRSTVHVHNIAVFSDLTAEELKDFQRMVELCVQDATT